MFDVVIPAFNAEASVAKAVKSAAQSGSSTVFVVDDGSSDSTSATAASAGAIVVTQLNAGASKARQHGAEKSSAKFLIFLDADDQLIAEGVKASLRIMEHDESYVAVGGGVEAIMPNGRARTIPRIYEGIIRTDDLISVGYGAWPPGAAVVRRDAYLASLEHPVGRVKTRYAEDYEMLLRLSLVGKIFAHHTPAILYRMYNGKSSVNNFMPLLDKEKIRAHYAAETGISYDVPSATQLKSSSFFRSARLQWARGELFGALRATFFGVCIAPRATARKVIQHLKKA